MNSVLLILSLVVATYALTEKEYRSAFEEFKVKYSKTYLPSEEGHRYRTFKAKLDFVNNWDANKRGFTVAINKFSDLTNKEFVSIYNGMNITKHFDKRAHVHSTNDNTGVRDTVIIDWRTKGAVTGIKDQGQCGSCWAFSTTGSVEGANAIAGNQLTPLSEQQLVDCSTAQGNQGCNGGLMDQAFQYIIALTQNTTGGGLETEDQYPYTASDGTCNYQPPSSGQTQETIVSFQDVTSGDEGALLKAVQSGPTSVAIDASQDSFQSYSGGVYSDPNCSSTQLDHGVLAVGAGTDDSGNDYWIVKNSWGTSWGMNGYILMARNQNNMCGIATSASIPTAAKQ